MNILVRLPNWLGDVVMSFAFVEAVRHAYPGSTIDVIVPESLSALVGFCDGIHAVHSFAQETQGLLASRRFARRLGPPDGYDVFFCLPRSFSSAWMGWFTRSRARVGFDTELRGGLLTHAIPRPAGLHRVDEYLYLLTMASGAELPAIRVAVNATRAPVPQLPPGRNLVLNLNSAAPSRTVPLEFARTLITAVRRRHDVNVLLTGHHRDVPRMMQLAGDVGSIGAIHMYAGRLDLRSLVGLVDRADYVISTDSGVAHLANGLSKPTVVLVGASDERHTRPYNADRLRIVRKPGLSCAPCVSNTCKLGRPVCLADLDVERVMDALDALIDEPGRVPAVSSQTPAASRTD